MSLKLEKPLEAITGGASIRIDVSQYVKSFESQEVSGQFPDGIIEGKLIQKNGHEISLTNSGSSHGNDSVRLIVSADSPLPTGVKFVGIKLRSKIILESVNVYWKNGQQ